MPSSSDITALLGDWNRGNQSALNQLLPVVYAELRRMAARQLRGERAGHTLQPTALVHEAYLRLVDQRNVDWQNRAHFFGVSAQVMRRILVDHARRHNAIKRGDGLPCVSLDEANEVAGPEGIPVLALDQALNRLTGIDKDLARLVELARRRTDHRRGGVCSQGLPVYRETGLAYGQGLAHARARIS